MQLSVYVGWLTGWKFDEAKALATANETIKFRKENKVNWL
jgi:hypothetical protein